MVERSKGLFRYEGLVTDVAVQDSEVDLKSWLEKEHERIILVEANRLKVVVVKESLTHVWLDLDDADALKPLFMSGEFDITRGRPHPDFKWRLVSEMKYN